MTIPDFSGPFLKLERAKHHILELSRILSAYKRANDKLFIRQAQPNRRHKVRNLGSTKLPRDTPTILGDAIHNLRVCLDHAYSILVEANGHTRTDYTRFPFGKDRQSIEGFINGQIGTGNGPSEAIRDLILDRIQPYPGGEAGGLYAVHRLDISDKHSILIPTFPTMTMRDYALTLPDGSDRHITGDATFVAINKDMDAIVVLNPGTYIKSEYKAQICSDVCFANGQPYQGQSVLEILRSLAELTESTLNILVQLR